MKQYLILALTALIAIGIVSCNQNGVSPTDSTTTSLSSARIAGVTSTTGNNGTLTCGSSETVITADQLPAAVLTYLTTNYAGYTLVQAEQGTNLRNSATYYEVKFTLNGATKELHFDMTGAVLASSGGGGKGYGGSSSTEVVITADKLPATALTYLTTNYAGYTLVQAEQGTTPAGAVYYEVKFTLNGRTKQIHFDANGVLI